MLPLRKTTATSAERQAWRCVCEKRSPSGEGPGPRYGHSATIVGDRLYIFGGQSGSRDVKGCLYALELGVTPAEWKWERIESSGNQPPPRYDHSAVAHGTKIWIFGGRNARDYLNDLYAFDTVTKRWLFFEPKPGQVAPRPRAHHASLIYKGRVYIYGGKTRECTALGDIHYFDIEEEAWHKLPIENDLLPRWGHTMHLDGNSGHFTTYGGRTRGPTKNDLSYFAPPLVRCSLELEEARILRPRLSKAEQFLGFELPGLFHHSSCIYSGTMMLIFGGFRREDKLRMTSDKFYVFDVEKCEWMPSVTEEDKAIALPQITSHTATMYNDAVIVYGGRTSKKEVSDILYLARVERWDGRSPRKGDKQDVHPKRRALTGLLKRNIPAGNQPASAVDPRVQAMRRRKRMLQEKIKQYTADLHFSRLTFNGSLTIGASAHVYKGIFNGRVVAIKKFLDCEEESFLEECTVLRKLSHPNIVKYIGSCRQPSMCVVMEYLPLGNLMDFLVQTMALPLCWQFVLAVARDIARAMEYIHAQGFIHRDLKSSNILIASTNHNEHVVAKVMDFGDSRAATHCEELSHTVGTPRWRAPEVGGSFYFSPKSDVYSYGVILWELCSRELPFNNIRFDSQVERVVRSGVRPPMPPTALPGFSNLIRSCWDENPDKRPTFPDILTTLEGLSRVLPATATLAGSLEGMSKSLRKSRSYTAKSSLKDMVGSPELAWIAAMEEGTINSVVRRKLSPRGQRTESTAAPCSTTNGYLAVPQEANQAAQPPPSSPRGESAPRPRGSTGRGLSDSKAAVISRRKGSEAASFRPTIITLDAKHDEEERLKRRRWSSHVTPEEHRAPDRLGQWAALERRRRERHATRAFDNNAWAELQFLEESARCSDDSENELEISEDEAEGDPPSHEPAAPVQAQPTELTQFQRVLEGANHGIVLLVEDKPQQLYKSGMATRRESIDFVPGTVRKSNSDTSLATALLREGRPAKMSMMEDTRVSDACQSLTGRSQLAVSSSDGHGGVSKSKSQVWKGVVKKNKFTKSLFGSNSKHEQADPTMVVVANPLPSIRSRTVRLSGERRSEDSPNRS